MMEPDFIKPIHKGLGVKIKSTNEKYNSCHRNNHEILTLVDFRNRVSFICKDCENSGELG